MIYPVDSIAQVDRFISLDFETASVIDIEVGSWAYSQHPSTRIWCAVIDVVEWGSEIPGGLQVHRFTWIPGMPLPQTIVELILAGTTVLAFNAGFERAICANICEPLHGWPHIRREQWTDAQTTALFYNLPASLAGTASSLGVPVKKDTEGQKLMRKMAKATIDPLTLQYVYDEDPNHLRRLIQYCGIDVDVTSRSHLAMLKPPLSEVRVLNVDSAVNERGVYLDQHFAGCCSELLHQRSNELVALAVRDSGGILPNSKNPHKLKEWVKSFGIVLPKRRRYSKKKKTWHMAESLDKEAVAEILANEYTPPAVRSVLENRQEANKATSLAKLARVNLVVGTDGRLRHSLQAHGAHTGRWTAYNFQLHNLPKPPKKQQLTLLRSAILNRDLAAFKLICGMVGLTPLQALSACLRTVVAAPPGKELIAADYSAIEARVLAWLAGQLDVLHIFASGRDIYVEDAAKIGSTNRQLGKVRRLALGYGMGNLKFIDSAKSYGVTVSRKEAYANVKGWREDNPMIVELWKAMEREFRNSIREPNKTFFVGQHIQIRTEAGATLMRLPSGRLIRYWGATIRPATKTFKFLDENGDLQQKEDDGDEIVFWTQNDKRDGMRLQTTYSGKLVENATQAVARDILGDGMVRIEMHGGYPIVVHVHDAIASEVDEGGGDVEEFCGMMRQMPDYAPDLPMEVGGYRERFFLG